MSMIADQHSRPCRRAGLCIAELIISIAIVAMLLTAVAAAFSASAQIIQENDQFFRATQAARVCMTQILTEVRRSQWVDDTSTSSTLRMITSNDQTCSYAYDATAGVVNLATEASYPLASNVSSCAFSLDVENMGCDIQQFVQAAGAEGCPTRSHDPAGPGRATRGNAARAAAVHED